MSSAAEAELGALYSTAHQTIIEMGSPQPCTPIQMNNSTAIGITNLTIVLQKKKSMDLSVGLRAIEIAYRA